MHTIDKLVRDMLDEHEGGKEFFDSLDENLRHKRWLQDVYNLAIQRAEDLDIDNIIVSGQFGVAFHNWVKYILGDTSINLYLLPGGLRRATEINHFDYLGHQFRGREFIFIDDSFYSGNTMNVIIDHVSDLGGSLAHTFVCYDGAKVKHPDVTSLYRYYDA